MDLNQNLNLSVLKLYDTVFACEDLLSLIAYTYIQCFAMSKLAFNCSKMNYTRDMVDVFAY